MKISIECPMCHKILEGESEWRGQKAQCPYCQHDFIIPEIIPEEDTTTAVESPPMHKKRSLKWLYVISATLFMLCVLAISSVVLACIIPPKSNKFGESTGKKSANINVARGKQQTKTDNSASDVPSQTKTSTRNTISKSSNNQPQVKKPAKKATSNPATKSVALKKSQPVVEPPKKRDYLGNMGFEKLVTTLSDFRDCTCDDCRKKFSSFFNEKWEGNYSLSKDHAVFIPQCVNISNLSYRQGKQIILQRYKDVIDYINELYNTPVLQLQEKYMSGKYVEYTEYGSSNIYYIFSKPPKFPVPTCLWHTKFLAERGCIKAQLAMGFNRGYCLDVNALKWTKKAANNGMSKACFLIGKCCIDESLHFDMYQGSTIKDVDLMKAGIGWLKKGAVLGDVDCMYALGFVVLYYLHNGTIALQWLEPAAAKGHGDALYRCAQIYSGGLGGTYEDVGVCTKNAKLDYRRAIKYYEQMISMYKNNKSFKTMADNNFKDMLGTFENIVENLKLKIED